MLDGPIALMMLFAGAPVVDTATEAAETGYFVPAIVWQADPFARQFMQVVVEERIIIRVPSRSSANSFAASPRSAPRPVTPPAPPVMWKETRAPRCLPMRNIIGVQAARKDSIDILTRERQRLRAQLKRGCRALDFYSGFYMKANDDGRLCEDRDMLHARSGAQCEVEKFRLMIPVTPDD